MQSHDVFLFGGIRIFYYNVYWNVNILLILHKTDYSLQVTIEKWKCKTNYTLGQY